MGKDFLKSRRRRKGLPQRAPQAKILESPKKASKKLKSHLKNAPQATIFGKDDRKERLTQNLGVPQSEMDFKAQSKNAPQAKILERHVRIQGNDRGD